MDPIGSIEKTLGYFERFRKSGFFDRTVAFLGKPVAWDLNKSDGSQYEKYKDECKGPIFLFRKYVLSWGNSIGVGGIVLSSLIGRFMPSGEGTIASKKGLLVSLLSLVGLGSIVGSIWGQASKKTVETYVQGPERLAKLGTELLKKVEHFLTDEEKSQLVARYKNNPNRYKDSERKNIERFIGNPGSPALAFLVGPPGTGKTEAMNWITSSIVEHEEKNNCKVEVYQVKGQDLQEIINGKRKEGEEFAGSTSELLSLAGSMLGVNTSQAQELVEYFKQNKLNLLKGVIFGIKQKLDEAKKDPSRRLIVQIDEIDNLFDVARGEGGKYDEEFVNQIAGTLGELFEKDRGYDILMTSNLAVEELCGLYTNYEGDPNKLKNSKMAKAYGRLSHPEVCTTVSLPDSETQAQIFSVYLKLNSSKVKLDLNGTERDTATKVRKLIDHHIKPLEEIDFSAAENLSDAEVLYKFALLRIKIDELDGRTIKGIIDGLAKDKDSITEETLIQEIARVAEQRPLDTKSNLLKVVTENYQFQTRLLRQEQEKQTQARLSLNSYLRNKEEKMREIENRAPKVIELRERMTNFTQKDWEKLRQEKYKEICDFLAEENLLKAIDYESLNRIATGYLYSLSA